MNTPFKKRTNPLAQTVAPIQQTVEQPKPAEQPTFVSQQAPTFVEQAPVYTQAPQPVYQATPKVAPQNDLSREKYTATMDKAIRRRVKIACANKGVQFSQYIEEAVIEKMRKEGF